MISAEGHHSSGHPTHIGTVRADGVVHVESVVTEFEPPRQLGMYFRTHVFTGHLTYHIEPTGEGSVLRQREVLRTRRPLKPLGTFLIRALRPHVMERLHDIKLLLETPA